MILKYNDKVHGYWLDGKRCKGVSSLAKIPDDNYSLDQWRKRMVAIGVANNLDLSMEIMEAEVNGDQSLLNELCEQAMTEAGAHEAALAGTAAHDRTEKHDTGQAVEETYELHLARWRALLDYAGLDIEPDLAERCIIYPERKICGRFDRLARRRSDGRLTCIDLKTGKNAVKYPHATAVQLALYARAPLMAGELTDTSKLEPDHEDYYFEGFTETFTPLPDDLDRQVGYMLHLPDSGEDRIYAISLGHGWQVANEVVFPTLAWRATPIEDFVKAI